MKGHLWIIVVLAAVSLSARAHRLDELLKSLDSRLPINSSFMKRVLKARNTRLAHPSLLDRWSVINTDDNQGYSNSSSDQFY